MIILQDTREQRPLEFTLDEVLTEVVREKLDVGDYGVRFLDGHQPPVVFERKNLADLFGTLGKGYQRFKRELLRAKTANVQLILIVEASVAEVLEGPPYSKMDGAVVFKRLMTLWVRYDLPVIFANEPKEAAFIVRQFFEAIGRNWVKEKRKQPPVV